MWVLFKKIALVLGKWVEQAGFAFGCKKVMTACSDQLALLNEYLFKVYIIPA